MHVLYSFPYRVGKTGIGNTAWQQVRWLNELGVSITLFCTSLEKPLPPSTTVRRNILGIANIPLRVLGPLAGPYVHDLQVANFVRSTRQRIDIFHGWPLGSEKSLIAANVRGIPTILENCNSHIMNICERVEREYKELGLRDVPKYLRDRRWTARHEMEYQNADYLACPSCFVVRSFIDRGYSAPKIKMTQYGYDKGVMSPGSQGSMPGFNVLFLGNGEPRKGLHYLLAAWSAADLPAGAQLSIAGRMEPEYRGIIERYIKNETIFFLGFQANPINILKNSHVLVLPSIEEGSALVTYEARAAGCVVLASDATGAIGQEGEGILFHRPGDTQTLTRQLELLAGDGTQYCRIRASGLALLDMLSWETCGRTLHQVYLEAIGRRTG